MLGLNADKNLAVYTDRPCVTACPLIHTLHHPLGYLQIDHKKKGGD